ncbi:MAG: ABC transporter permease [Candidatus Dependentiae bacterium]|nr:ABC transporter permease [Candidatus Dependentiae bacterium]
MINFSYLQIYKELIYTDLLTFRKNFFGKYIDLTIWVVLTIVVMGYIMPYFGLSYDFGVFQLGGVIAATGLFEVYSSVIDLVSDFEGDRIINYNFTLPIPSLFALLSKVGYYFIIYLILSLCMLPIGKLCLWNQWDLSQVHYLKLLLILIFQSIFFACFGLWAASIVKDMTQMGNVWSRFIFPMWFMGGFQFSWKAFYHAFPFFAYINLLNPMMYITEAVRTAILGQVDYLNFWLCLVAITLFSAIALVKGLCNLKKRLDFV